MMYKATDEDIDGMHEFINDFIKADRLDLLNGCLLIYDSDIILTVLTATLPIKSKLSNREILVDLAKKLNLPIEGLE